MLEGVATRAGAGLDRYVAAHPLAGSERAGWAAADAGAAARRGLGRLPAARRRADRAAVRARAALEPLGPRLLVCEARAHDAAVARTSHAPHVVAMALARAGEAGLAAALTGGAYRDMTRTAAADEALWSEILAPTGGRSPTPCGRCRASWPGSRTRSLPTTLRRRGDLAGGGGRPGARDVDPLGRARPGRRAVRAARVGRLLELGRAGRAVRRPRVEGDALALDVAALTA